MISSKVDVKIDDFKRIQLKYVKEPMCEDLKRASHDILDDIFDIVKESRGLSTVNHVIWRMDQILKKKSECDTGMVRGFLKNINILKNHRLAGRPDGKPLQGGKANGR